MARSSASQLDWLEMLDASTSSSEAPPVSPSASPGSEVDLLTTAATSRSSIADWLASFGPAGSSGKTCRTFSAESTQPLSPPSSGRWCNSGMASRGECSTLDTSEFHSGAVGSSLWQVLEEQPPPERYFLSPRAAAGILKRAERRGKKLPEPLRRALVAVAAVK